MVLDVDLNDAPPDMNMFEWETVATGHDSNVGQASGPFGTSAPIGTSMPIDVEAIDDEVMISSPTRFAEARKNSKRKQVITVTVDEELEICHCCSGRSLFEEPLTRMALNIVENLESFTNGSAVNRGLCMNIESSRSPKRRRTVKPRTRVENQNAVVPEDDVMPSAETPQATVTKDSIFSCAICMGPLVKETSTICGHIFCMKCIKAAIAAQKKCPTCRRKLNARNIHRVFLPTTN